MYSILRWMRHPFHVIRCGALLNCQARRTLVAWISVGPAHTHNHAFAKIRAVWFFNTSDSAKETHGRYVPVKFNFQGLGDMALSYTSSIVADAFSLL
jgi:hypothetical protein